MIANIIDRFREVKKLTFSPMNVTVNQEALHKNILRLSFWNILGTGSIAIISGIFSRGLLQQSSWSAFAPYVFRASLASCGTGALVAAFLLYKTANIQASKVNRRFFLRLNNQTARLENIFSLYNLAWAAAAIFAKSHFKESHSIGLIAKDLIHSFLWTCATGLVIRAFHKYQDQQLQNHQKQRKSS
jgi:hypothetical protein